MIWVIMMFSAAIPMLYLSGFVLCFVLYWTDKTLFVKFFRTPPKHGSSLGHQVRSIIEWSLICHLFMGLYMISNPEIFSSEEDDNQAVAFLQTYSKFIGVGISFLTGVDSSRFGQVHTVLYSFGIGIFIILFIIEKLSWTFSSAISKFCCCCLNKDTEPDAFSSDIYKEISNESQRKEYKECKQLHKKVNDLITNDPNNEFTAVRNYYLQRIELLVKTIRYQLLCQASLAKIDKAARLNT